VGVSCAICEDDQEVIGRLAKSDSDRTAKLKVSIQSYYKQNYRQCNVNFCEAEVLHWRLHVCLPFFFSFFLPTHAIEGRSG
jgi:hypothetical protein